MKDIYYIIQLIRIRPPLYIGENSITTLYQFLNGCQFALKISGVEEKPNFMDFHTWVRERLQLSPMSVNYATTLLEYFHDEEIAMQKFFILIDEYRAETNT